MKKSSLTYLPNRFQRRSSQWLLFQIYVIEFMLIAHASLFVTGLVFIALIMWFWKDMDSFHDNYCL